MIGAKANMSLVIQLPQDMEQKLREKAASAGQKPEELARQLVESGLTVSLEEDLARFRKAVLDSGETEEQTGQFFQQLVDEVRAERERPRS
jgi:predicted transcriptional regulator